jgi:hypothetical protein
MAGDFKGTFYQKNGTLYTGPRKNNLQILFFSKIEKNLLSAYMENTLNGKKSVEMKYISVNTRAP